MKKTVVSKRLRKVFCVILSAMIIFGSTYTGGVFSAIAAAAEPTHYYETGTNVTYMKYLVSAYSGSESTAKSLVTSTAKATLLNKDLNDGAGGDFVYIGWTTTTNPAEAITGVRVKMYTDKPSSLGAITDSNGITWYPANSGYNAEVPNLTGDGCVDLNEDAGGKYIYLYITKDQRQGPPMSSIAWNAEGYTGDTTCTAVTDMDSTSSCRNVNYDAGGENIYLFSKSTCVKVDPTELRSIIAEAEPYVARAENYTNSAADMVEAYNNAVALNAEIVPETALTTVSPERITEAINALNTAIDQLAYSVTYDAKTNGGDWLQNKKITYQVGREENQTIQFNTIATPSKSGYAFMGWSYTVDGNNIGSSATINKNTTFYAQYYGEKSFPIYTLSNENGDYAVNYAEVGFKNNDTISTNTYYFLAPTYFPDSTRYGFSGYRTDMLPIEGEYKSGQYSTLGIEDKSFYAVFFQYPEITVKSPLKEDVRFSGDMIYFNTGDSVENQSRSTIKLTPQYSEIPHYIFKGYALTEGGEVVYEPNTTFEIDNDLTLYAVHEPVKYKVTFKDLNGNVIEEQEVDYNTAATEPNIEKFRYLDNNSSSHYIFTGWNKEFSKIAYDTTVTALYEKEAHVEEGLCVCGGVRLNEQNFPCESFITSLSAFDKDTNSFLTFTEIQSATSLQMENITDLTGIEFLTELTYLKCVGGDEGKLESIDLSKNKKLETLDLTSNSLTSLNLENNTQLKSVCGDNNNLGYVDLSNNKLLETISFENSGLTSIDLSNNEAVEYVDVSNNSITEFDLSNNAQIDSLFCSYNNIAQLDVTSCSNLRYLYCGDNDLVNLNVKNNGELLHLNCDNNLLDEIDVSGCPKLIVFYCGNNNLSEVDLTDKGSLLNFRCSNNDISYISLSGAQNLKEAECQENGMLEIDISNNTKLNYLNVDDNNLTHIDLSNNTSLERLYCKNNKMASIDMSKAASTGLYANYQYIDITVDCSQKFDMSTIDSYFDGSKIVAVSSGVTVDGNVLTIPYGEDGIYYKYDAGKSLCAMIVYLNITHTHGNNTYISGKKDATCAELGYTGDVICKICNNIFEEGQDIPKLNHDIVDGVCNNCDYENRVVYFDNSLSNWENVGVYCWDDTGAFLVENNPWPGEPAELMDSAIYKYEINRAGYIENYEDYYRHYTMIIFNDFKSEGAKQTTNLDLHCCGIYNSKGFTGEYNHSIVNNACQYCGKNQYIDTVNSVIIDEENRILFSKEPILSDPTWLFTAGTDYLTYIRPSYTSKDGNVVYYGTGTEIYMDFPDGTRTVYTVVVEGDINSDGICDVLDVARVSDFVQGRDYSVGMQRYAAKGYNRYVNEELTVDDYTQIVNKALS